MTAETDPVHPVLKNVPVIRAVGVMAGCALRPPEWRVDVFRLFCFFRFPVAGKAEVDLFRSEEAFVLGGMGAVAGQTSLSCVDGRMFDGNGRLFFGVAGETELIVLMGDQLQVFGGMRAVA